MKEGKNLVGKATNTTANTLRSVVFVDLPNLTKGDYVYDLLELFRNLRSKFDEVRVYVKAPKKENENECNLILTLAKTGALPLVCPSDPDPIIASEIHRFSQYEHVETIALVSGDNGYFYALEFAKSMSKKIVVILPIDCISKLLQSVADDVQSIEDYTDYYPKEERLKEILEKYA